MSGYRVVEMKRQNLVLWVFQFCLRPLTFPFDLLEFSSLGMWIPRLKQSFRRPLKQQLSNLVVPYEQFFSYQCVKLVHCRTVTIVLIRRAVEETSMHVLILCVHKQELTWYSNFWCIPLGVAVSCCLQC